MSLNLDSLLRFVKREKNVDIKFSQLNFSTLLKENDIAELRKADGFVFYDKDEKAYYIAIESEKSTLFKRFAFVHELSHILLNHVNNVQVSTHIASDFEYEGIDEKENEANMFALMLLMPNVSFDLLYKRGMRVEELAKVYKVSLEAVLSRIKLVGAE